MSKLDRKFRSRQKASTQGAAMPGHHQPFSSKSNTSASAKYKQSTYSTALTGGWTSEASEGPTLHAPRYDNFIQDADLDRSTYYHYPNYTSEAEQMLYQEVQRSGRGVVNPPYGRSQSILYTQLFVQSGGQSQRRSHTSTRELRPVMVDPAYSFHQNYASKPHQEESVEYSNLTPPDLLERLKTTTRQLARDARETTPYDAVGYVGRQSDYERYDEYPQCQYQDEEIDATMWAFDDRSSITLVEVKED